MENLIIDYTLQFGETNAGEPYRLMTCATARAMGIMIGNEEFTGNETRWCSTEIQSNYIKTFPYMVRNYHILQWNKRYIQYKHLVESIRNSTSTGSNEPITIHDTGKYVEKNKKTFVPLILFLCFCGYFSLIVSPLYASVSNPNRNIKRLQIKVANYDNLQQSTSLSTSSSSLTNSIGDAFITYLKDYKTVNDGNIPDLQFIAHPQSVSPSDLEDQVLDLEAWGAVYVNPDATTSLLAALAEGCSTTTSYDAKDAITFIWDESRNSGVSGGYIASFLRTVITEFGITYQQQLVQHLRDTVTSTGDNALLTCLSSTSSSTQALMTQPILYTEINLTPTSVSPTFNSVGVTDGSIYVAVFGANYIVGATYSNTAALVEDMSPLGKVIIRGGTMSALCLGLSICFATISKLSQHLLVLF